MLCFSALVTLLVAYAGKLYVAAMIYVDIRQYLAAIGCLYFGLSLLYFDSSSSNKYGTFRKGGIFLIFFSALLAVTGALLIWSTVHNGYNIKSVAYYQLNDSRDNAYYLFVIVTLIVSWIAYWLILALIMRSVWANSRGAFASSTARNLAMSSSIDITRTNTT